MGETGRKRWKKAFKIFGWTLLSMLMVILLAFGIACYILFTPSRLTPIVNRIVGNYITCDYEIGRVELTFFSTFPRLGVRIDGLMVVNPVEGAQNDTVLHAQAVTATVDLKQWLFHNDLIVSEAVLENTDLNYFVAQDGTTNFDFFVTEPEDSTPIAEEEIDSTASILPFDHLRVDGLRIEARRITYLDEQDTVYASLGASTLYAHANSWNDMYLDLQASDVCAVLQGETYADNIRMTFVSPVEMNLDSMRFDLDQARLTWNEFAMTLDGEIVLGDSTELDMQLITHDTWDMESLMVTLPHTWVESVEEYKPKGNLNFRASVQGVISETQMPIVKVPQLHLNLWQSQFDIDGTISDMETDMFFDVNMVADMVLPDFKQFFPDDMTVDGKMKGTAQAQLRSSDLENGVFSQGKIDLSSNLLRVKMDTTLDAELGVTTIHLHGKQLLADKGAEYNLTLTGDYVEGRYDDMNADMDEAKLDVSLLAGKRIKSELKAKSLAGRVGQENKGEANTVVLQAAARYNPKESNLLLQWNPRVGVKMKDGEFYAPDVLPEILYTPSIDFSYSNKIVTIDSSYIEIGNSDLELKGEVRNIGKWFRKEEVLEGELNVLSDHCDANQLLTWISDDKGSEEEDEEPVEEQSQITNQQSPITNDSVQESKPFLVPTDVNVALNTHLKEVEWNGETARDLHGGIYMNDGILVLDEVGFICRAAKLQLSAMYRTPRKNHLYLGLDYHMIDVDIDELRGLIPTVDSTMPMLRSFGGDVQFHLAAETYLNSQYEPKMSTLRGASSITGTNLIIRDSKEFNEIARLLLLKKKPVNRVDSINAEVTIYKKEIDVYPLCAQVNDYMIALGGRHNTNMTFNYDINVLKPIYLGVNISGTFDDLKIKLAKCKFAEDFRPHWYQKADTQGRELRERIKKSMEKNVRIKSDKSPINNNQ